MLTVFTYLKDKNHNSKKKYKNYKTLNTILKSVDSIVIIGATSTSVTLSTISFGFVIITISTGIACSLSLCNIILHEIVMKKYIIKEKTVWKRSSNNQIFW